MTGVEKGIAIVSAISSALLAIAEVMKQYNKLVESKPKVPTSQAQEEISKTNDYKEGADVASDKK